MENNRRSSQQYPRRTPSKPVQSNYNRSRAKRPVKKKKKFQPIVMAIVLLLVLIIVLCVACGGKDDKTPQTNLNIEQQVFPHVVYDANNVKLTITGYNPNGIMGSEIEYTFENNASIDVMLGVGDAYIDGWKITTLGGETLSSGTKTNGTIYLSDDEIEKCGITDISSITLKECNIWNDVTYDIIDTFDITLNLN